MAISDLPRDMLEEVLCRVPLTSMRTVRFTCKKWNNIISDQSFAKKHIQEAKKKQVTEEFEAIMLDNFRVHLMSVDLHGFIMRKGTLIRRDDNDHDIYKVFPCDGLLLCILSEVNTTLVVWNPYFGHTISIEPRISCLTNDRDNYAFGYESRENDLLSNHKILRFVDRYFVDPVRDVSEFELYSFESGSWKVLDVTRDWEIGAYARGSSVKGNTYWFAREKYKLQDLGRELAHFLICFDFTSENFGPRLPLPFKIDDPSGYDTTVTHSSVGEDQLAVLFQHANTRRMEIWVTSKIEPKEVSWNKLFLQVDMEGPLDFRVLPWAGSFFIEQKENGVVVFHKDDDYIRSIAYFIGKEGYIKEVDLGESPEPSCWPLLWSYVPSSVQIKQVN